MLLLGRKPLIGVFIFLLNNKKEKIKSVMVDINAPELTILINDSTLPHANTNLFREGECFKMVNASITIIKQMAIIRFIIKFALLLVIISVFF